MTHPSFTFFSPLSDWYNCPRPLTYVRKMQELHPYQTAIDISSDFLQIVISVGQGRKLGVWNMFNAPVNSIGARDRLKTLLEAPGTPNFVTGDLNLRHSMWDHFRTSTSQEARTTTIRLN